MGNDKTSWLNLDEDDDILGQEATDFDDDVGRRPEGTVPSNDMPTQAYPQAGSPYNDAQTVLEPGVEKTEFHVDLGQDEGEAVDPVVGWLVVVKGPGIGKSVTLGAGMNTLGRDEKESVCVGFGDKQISGSDHLRIIYDDANRAFFLAPGSGRNISRVNGQIVAQTMPMENHALIELSKKTHVRFVAFCNDKFDWSDLQADDG